MADHGLVGDLYSRFEASGKMFYRFLIGEERASSDALRNKRIIVGGIIYGTKLGFFFGLASGILGSIVNADSSLGTPIFFACLAFSIFLSVIVANIVLDDVKKVEADAEEKKRIEKIYNKKYKELLDQGLSGEQAAEEAESYVNRKSTGGCFIATAVYGSAAAFEVQTLRSWRDEQLGLTIFGRYLIRLYYLISPGIALKMAKAPRLADFTRRILDHIVRWIAFSRSQKPNEQTHDT